MVMGNLCATANLGGFVGEWGVWEFSSPSHTPLQLRASSSSLGKQPEFPQQQNGCGLDLRQDFNREVVMMEGT